MLIRVAMPRSGLSKEEAIRNVALINQHKPCQYHLVPFKDYKGSRKLKSGSYDNFLVLCLLNSHRDAGWLVCRYISSGSYKIDEALFVFNPASGGTGRLNRHLNKHTDAKTATIPFSRQLPSTSVNYIANAAAYAVALDLRPISFTDGHKGMEIFIDAVFRTGPTVPITDRIDTKCFMPSARSVRNALADKAADNRNELRSGVMDEILRDGGALTTDAVTLKQQGKHFYDLSMHFMEVSPSSWRNQFPRFAIRVMTLLLVEGPDSPNAANIRLVLNDALKSRYDLTLHKLSTTFTFVTDGASVMANVAGSSASPRLASESHKWMPCATHQFDTAMKVTMARITDDSTNDNFNKICEDFKIVKKVVTHAKQSGWNSRLPVGYRLIQEVPTRFSTWLFVVERFLKSSAKVQELVHSLNSSVPLEAFASLLTERDRDGVVVGFPALEAIVDAFEPLSEAQKSFEAAKTPTLHLVLPAFQSCLDELDRISRGGHVWRGESRGHVSPSIYSRRLCALVREILVEKAKVHDLWLVGCFMHPFFRELQFIPDIELREAYKTRAESVTRLLYRQLKVTRSSEDVNEADVGSTEVEASDSLPGGMRNFGKRKFSLMQYADTHFQSTNSIDEVGRYKNLDITSLHKVQFMEDDFSSMRFWHRQRISFPVLYKVAKRVLATPVSSCASERVFSALSLIATPGRASMSADTLDDIIVLRTWRP